MRVSSAIIQVFSSPSLSHLYETPPLRCSRFQSLSLSLSRSAALQPFLVSPHSRAVQHEVGSALRRTNRTQSIHPSLRRSFHKRPPAIPRRELLLILALHREFSLQFFPSLFLFFLVCFRSRLFFFLFFFAFRDFFFLLLFSFSRLGRSFSTTAQLHQLIQHFSGKTPRPSTITYKVSISWRRGGL